MNLKLALTNQTTEKFNELKDFLKEDYENAGILVSPFDEDFAFSVMVDMLYSYLIDGKNRVLPIKLDPHVFGALEYLVNEKRAQMEKDGLIPLTCTFDTYISFLIQREIGNCR